MKSVVSLVLCCAVLAGCSWRSLNPLNWFGGGTTSNAPVEAAIVDDGTTLIPQLLSARAERTPSGVIVHATGLASAQGAFKSDLRAVYGEDGGFSHLEFRVTQPAEQAIGPDASRAIVAVGYFTRAESAALGSVTIRAAQNSLSVNLR
jgi:hypothetical protein